MGPTSTSWFSTLDLLWISLSLLDVFCVWAYFSLFRLCVGVFPTLMNSLGSRSNAWAGRLEEAMRRLVQDVEVSWCPLAFHTLLARTH